MTSAVKEVSLTNVVARLVAPKFTTAPSTKSEPVRVRVNGESPTGALVLESWLKVAGVKRGEK